MRIYVRNKAAEDALDVEATDTVASLKATIQAKLRLTDEDLEQRLFVIDGRDMSNLRTAIFDGSVRELPADGGSTLAECGLRDGDPLRVGFKGSFEISLHGSSEFTDFIDVSCYDTVRDLKKKYFQMMGAPMGACDFSAAAEDRTLLSFGLYNIYKEPGDEAFLMLQISIEFPNMPWRTRLLYFGVETTIGDMREDIIAMSSDRDQIICCQRYIREGLFVLFHGRRQLCLLGEHTTLDECGIKHMDSIQVFEDAPIPISIHGQPPRDLVLQMRCFDTVGALKSKLQDATGAPKQEQRLMYKEWYLDDEERRLVDYGIAMPVRYECRDKFCCRSERRLFLGRRPEEEFIIHLIASSAEPEPNTLQITVEIPNTPWRFPLMLKPTDTIGTLREGIIDKCHRQQGGLCDQSYIADGMFVLFFNKEQFMDESITLDKSRIRHMDKVQLFEKASFDIAVTAPDRSGFIDVAVRCYDTVAMLKDKLQLVTAIPKEDQCFKYIVHSVDWYLDDDERFLGDCGISKQDDHNMLVVNSKRCYE